MGNTAIQPICSLNQDCKVARVTINGRERQIAYNGDYTGIKKLDNDKFEFLGKDGKSTGVIIGGNDNNGITLNHADTFTMNTQYSLDDGQIKTLETTRFNDDGSTTGNYTEAKKLGFLERTGETITGLGKGLVGLATWGFDGGHMLNQAGEDLNSAFSDGKNYISVATENGTMIDETKSTGDNIVEASQWASQKAGIPPQEEERDLVEISAIERVGNAALGTGEIALGAFGTLGGVALTKTVIGAPAGIPLVALSAGTMGDGFRHIGIAASGTRKETDAEMAS